MPEIAESAISKEEEEDEFNLRAPPTEKSAIIQKSVNFENTD